MGTWGKLNFWESQKTCVQHIFTPKPRHYLLPSAETKLTKKIAVGSQILGRSKGAIVAC